MAPVNPVAEALMVPVVAVLEAPVVAVPEQWVPAEVPEQWAPAVEVKKGAHLARADPVAVNSAAPVVGNVRKPCRLTPTSPMPLKSIGA